MSSSFSSSRSTKCCFSLFGHFPPRQSKVVWVDHHHASTQRTSDNDTDDTTTSSTMPTTTTSRMNEMRLENVKVTTSDQCSIAITTKIKGESVTTDTTIHKQNDTTSTTTTTNDNTTTSNKTNNKRMVLMEIVGAMGLETKQRKKVDPYCIVRVNQNKNNSNSSSSTTNNTELSTVVHRTDTIHNDGNPIWTVQTKSLCIIDVTSPSTAVTTVDRDGVVDSHISSSSRSSSITNNNKNGEVVIDVYHGNSQLFDGFITTPLMDFVSFSSSTTNSVLATQLIKDMTSSIIPSQLQQQLSLVIQQQQPLGRVTIPFDEIVRCCNWNSSTTTGADRMEFPIQTTTPATTTSSQQPQKLLETATMAVRFRFVTERDILFLMMISKSYASLRESSSLKDSSIDKNNSSLLSNVSTALLWPLKSRHEDSVARDAADINFRYVKKKSLTLSCKKKDKDGVELVRVQPYPDPDRIDTTTWMSAVEMERIVFEPSTKWIRVGNGTLGVVHCEILGCNDLPQMDATQFSSTDPVVTMTMEDTFVRTDVIWDQLNPRWMPWTTRAYQFNIRHPASILCISVLDCDETTVFDRHDPVGRVVIQPCSFQPNFTYTLHYALQDDPSEEPTTPDNISSSDVDDDDDENDENTSSKQRRRRVGSSSIDKPSRGTIIIRLRIEWVDESLAMKMYYTAPPRFIINVDNEKSYEALTYTTRGVGYMHTASIKSVKLLAHEVMEYGSHFCFVLDVLMEILLWRGRCYITNSASIWFPIHSIALLIGAVTLVEHPDWVVPICLYGISWILLSVNFHGSNHPNPWLRVPPYIETLCMTVLGRRTLLLVSHKYDNCDGLSCIAANEGIVEAIRQEKLDELKAARMSALISATMTFLIKVYSIYSKTSNKAIKITTDRTNKWNILSSKLKYIHMVLLYMCQYLRLGRNFVGWKSNYTAVVISYCLTVATIWCIFPISTVVHWTVRTLVFVFLGPWVKFLDIVFVHRWYATKDELLARINRGEYTVQESDLPDFDSILKNKTISRLIHLGRVRAEELYQLRDMRQLLFGQFSELIPFVDNSRYPSIPLPQSSAIRTTALHEMVDSNIRYHVPGQLLSGNMIHTAD